MPRRVEPKWKNILGGALKGGGQMMSMLAGRGDDGQIAPPDFDFNDPQVQEEIRRMLQRMGPTRVGRLG